MRINHNLQALNAWHQLTATDGRLSKSLERLSSGLRINRAADDAAGLAVSEKMRAQIRSIGQSVRNAQDGISLLQTAEGALQEDSAILQRMRELALQASSDTLTNADRLHLQKEVEQLVGEFDRISKTTEFNTALLLTGEFSSKQIQIGPNSGADYQLAISFQCMTAVALGLVGESAPSGTQAAATIGAGANGAVTVTADEAGATGNSYSIQVVEGVGNGVAMSAALDTNTNTITVTLGTDGAGALDATKNTALLIGAAVDALDDVSAAHSGDGSTALAGAEALQSFTGGTNGDLSVSTRDGAQGAIATIDAALNTISAERATMGAWQNRLEHTITNLGISSENLTAAESRIRDVDMAAEMMSFTKNQILIQSGTAMLAQANMKPQSVLQLLA